MRIAKIAVFGVFAGILTEEDGLYTFRYDEAYIRSADCAAVSLTLPLQEEPFQSRTLFPFFDGLIPEGWLLDIAAKNWKLDGRDRMGLLMNCCKDCIGSVSVLAAEEVNS